MRLEDIKPPGCDAPQLEEMSDYDLSGTRSFGARALPWKRGNAFYHGPNLAILEHNEGARDDDSAPSDGC